MYIFLIKTSLNYLLSTTRDVSSLFLNKSLRNNPLAVHRTDPMFSDRYAWANSADSDQTAV